MKVKLCYCFFDRSDRSVVEVAVALSLVEVVVGCFCSSCLYCLDCLFNVCIIFDLLIDLVLEVGGVSGDEERLPSFE